MTPHHFRPGDEVAHAALLGESGRPATPTAEALRRRFSGRAFDPELVWYAEERGELVAALEVEPGGRVHPPVVRAGHDHAANTLLGRALAALADRGCKAAWAAVPAAEATGLAFMRDQGFADVGEVLNFAQDGLALPTIVGQPGQRFTPFEPADLAVVVSWPNTPFTGQPPAALLAKWESTHGCGAHSLRVLRRRGSTEPLALGRFVQEPGFADAAAFDAKAAEFARGAFGFDAIRTQPVNGFVDLIAAPGVPLSAAALDLVGDAAASLDGDVSTLLVQVTPDRPGLAPVVARHFRKLGGFPLLRLALA